MKRVLVVLFAAALLAGCGTVTKALDGIAGVQTAPSAAPTVIARVKLPNGMGEVLKYSDGTTSTSFSLPPVDIDLSGSKGKVTRPE
jgi:uncharacterized protein YceK